MRRTSCRTGRSPSCREAVEIEPDGSIRLRVDSEARGAALYELTHGAPAPHGHDRCRGIPTLLVLATEPEDVRDANERLVVRFAEAVPHAEIVRPGCRHAVFADLGAGAGDVVVEWLQRQGIT